MADTVQKPEFVVNISADEKIGDYNVIKVVRLMDRSFVVASFSGRFSKLAAVIVCNALNTNQYEQGKVDIVIAEHAHLILTLEDEERQAKEKRDEMNRGKHIFE